MDLFESSSVAGAAPLVTATFELPGLRKEDVRIDVLDNKLIVAGERRHLSAQAELSRKPGERYAVREIKRGRFKRVVSLPAGTKLEDVKASLIDGILTVTFPGSPPPVPRNIPLA
ncbi:HSP20-like chaperone [Gautieria morchelliformis]|nr:HSP20-like chaperone [Gautieria morchelliformis]